MMTKEEVKRYIALHGDAREVVDTIKEMQAEGIDVTEQALDERLAGITEEDYDVEFSAEYETPPKKKFDFKVVLVAAAVGAVIAIIGFVIGVVL